MSLGDTGPEQTGEHKAKRQQANELLSHCGPLQGGRGTQRDVAAELHLHSHAHMHTHLHTGTHTGLQAREQLSLSSLITVIICPGYSQDSFPSWYLFHCLRKASLSHSFLFSHTGGFPICLHGLRFPFPPWPPESLESFRVSSQLFIDLMCHLGQSNYFPTVGL